MLDDPPPHLFEYAVLRVVPRVDRGEAMNAGVLLYCRPLDYLGPGSAGQGPAARARPGRRRGAVERALQAASESAADPGAGRLPGRTSAQVRLADRAAQHGRAAGPGAHRPDQDPDAEAERLLRALVRRPS